MSFVLSSSAVSDAEMSVYRALEATWKRPHGREYETADVTEKVRGCIRAVLLKIPPGGSVHRHVDTGDCKTDHIVLSSNDGCKNYWSNGNGEEWIRMEPNHRYSVDRTIEHWSVNEGTTDRVHLLVEY